MRRARRISPEKAVSEFADVLKLYRCYEILGDRYAGEWPREQFINKAGCSLRSKMRCIGFFMRQALRLESLIP